MVVTSGVTLDIGTDLVTAMAAGYRWTLDPATDRFSLADATGREILSAPAQPVIVATGPAGAPVTAKGTIDSVRRSDDDRGDGLVVRYSGVGGSGSLEVGWRFDDAGMWTDELNYHGVAESDVVAVQYFSDQDAGVPRPGLAAGHLVQPGRSGSPVLGTVLDLGSKLATDTWIGRGDCTDADRLSQQWGLPSHFVAVFSLQCHPNRPGAFTRNRSDAVCLGLAEVPAADVRVITAGARAALVLDVRSDLWGHVRGVGPHRIGARLRWSFGEDYRTAIRGYYRDLLGAGVVARKQISPAKAAALAASEYNPWGAQLAIEAEADKLDQDSLEAIYSALRSSAMRPDMFVVDDMWQQQYGPLVHSSDRLPRFPEFLERVRADGMMIGMWAAFLRCSDPGLLGLGPEHLLRDGAGEPIKVAWGAPGRYHFLFDLSVTETATVLTEHIREFVRRYRPELVKFDFGYELPTLARSMPADATWAGERLLYNSLQVIVEALRAENPDIALMYYSLSPLYTPLVDLHSTDDIWQSVGEHPAGANRRTFFASLLGELGVPTYGSGGYNWTDIDQIWFDAAASGPPGSLGSFDGDQFDTSPTARQLAVYNGIAALTRTDPLATIEAIDPVLIGGSAGARSESWGRYESGRLTLLALRTCRDSEGMPAARFPDLLTSTAQLVLASRTDDDLYSTGALGIVPFGPGELTLHRAQRPVSASATFHTTGSPPRTIELSSRGNSVTVPLLVRSGRSPVEWIEIRLG